MAFTLEESEINDIIHIQIFGNKYLSKEEYLKYSQLTDLDNTSKLSSALIRDRLEKHPYIKNIDVLIVERGIAQIEIFEKTVEHRLMNPTFITAYPTEVSPLARRNDEDPFVTDRFEFFVGGREIANGFSELNDAEDQAERFKAQVEEKEAGDDEAMFFDQDYITALEHGMPPTAGEGFVIVC